MDEKATLTAIKASSKATMLRFPTSHIMAPELVVHIELRPLLVLRKEASCGKSSQLARMREMTSGEQERKAFIVQEDEHVGGRLRFW